MTIAVRQSEPADTYGRLSAYPPPLRHIGPGNIGTMSSRSCRESIAAITRRRFRNPQKILSGCGDGLFAPLFQFSLDGLLKPFCCDLEKREHGVT